MGFLKPKDFGNSILAPRIAKIGSLRLKYNFRMGLREVNECPLRSMLVEHSKHKGAKSALMTKHTM